jgi:UDP-N-acetylmuramoylalanine--D-glutamate ligase
MKVAIAGYGIEGRSNYDYFAARGHEMTIVDERPRLDEVPEGAKTIVGPGAFEKLNGFDMVVRTASLAPRKIKTDGKVWSATNEFFAECPAAIIGVTGSKGKGTTSSLIASILREAGRTVHLLGNIGVPALSELPKIKPDDIVVYELSSFQLWDVEKSPTVAVVLMIEPDHLDVHVDFDDYVTAKANIRKFQTEKDSCFYHPTNEISRRIAMINPLPNAHRYDDPQDAVSAYVNDNNFVVDGKVICPTSALQLPGKHNLENACAAISAALAFTDQWSAVERGLRAFTGLPHRLKFVREIDDVKYYDDSIATTPGSAIAALKAFDQPKVMILGGSYKGGDFQEMAELAGKSNVRQAILIGQEAARIQPLLEKEGVVLQNLGEDVKMPAIVAAARRAARPGDVVLMSPACASFGMFKNYQDRGEQFVAAVEALD